MAQSDFAALFTRIVEEARGDLKAILVCDLKEGLPLYCNTQLKNTYPRLFEALFDTAKGTTGAGFNSLDKIQDSLNSFGKVTLQGELQYSIFKLEEGTMMVYFDELPSMPIAICFIAPSETNLGNVVFQSRRKIDEIKAALKQFQ